jgi:hypothetical protein
MDLLNTPQDIPFLSGLIQREIIYRSNSAVVSPVAHGRTGRRRFRRVNLLTAQKLSDYGHF